jgi:NAD-dependent dihydropyrimidine dehydrogenase PreA subunit
MCIHVCPRKVFNFNNNENKADLLLPNRCIKKKKNS